MTHDFEIQIYTYIYSLQYTGLPAPYLPQASGFCLGRAAEAKARGSVPKHWFTPPPTSKEPFRHQSANSPPCASVQRLIYSGSSKAPSVYCTSHGEGSEIGWDTMASFCNGRSGFLKLLKQLYAVVCILLLDAGTGHLLGLQNSSRTFLISGSDQSMHAWAVYALLFLMMFIASKPEGWITAKITEKNESLKCVLWLKRKGINISESTKSPAPRPIAKSKM